MVVYYHINSYVRIAVHETTLDRVAFLGKLIMIGDSSLTSSAMLSSDELRRYFARLHTRASWFLSLFIFMVYYVFRVRFNSK